MSIFNNRISRNLSIKKIALVSFYSILNETFVTAVGSTHGKHYDFLYHVFFVFFRLQNLKNITVTLNMQRLYLSLVMCCSKTMII